MREQGGARHGTLAEIISSGLSVRGPNSPFRNFVQVLVKADLIVSSKMRRISLHGSRGDLKSQRQHYQRYALRLTLLYSTLSHSLADIRTSGTLNAALSGESTSAWYRLRADLMPSPGNKLSAIAEEIMSCLSVPLPGVTAHLAANDNPKIASFEVSLAEVDFDCRFSLYNFRSAWSCFAKMSTITRYSAWNFLS